MAQTKPRTVPRSFNWTFRCMTEETTKFTRFFSSAVYTVSDHSGGTVSWGAGGIVGVLYAVLRNRSYLLRFQFRFWFRFRI